MEAIQSVLFKVTSSAATTLFIYNSILLFLTGNQNRLRKILALTNLMWGILYLTLTLCDFFNIEISTYPIISVNTLIISNFFICIMYIYPLEIVSPDSLKTKKLAKIFGPSLLVTLGYYGVLFLRGEEIEDLKNFQALYHALGNFNVWYRFIIIACNLVYSYFLLKILYRYKKESEDNQEGEDTNIQVTEQKAWIDYYYNMMIVLVLFYLVTVFWGSEWNIIIYNSIIIGCFSVLFYKGLFHNRPTTHEIESQPVKPVQSTPKESTVKQLPPPESFSLSSRLLEDVKSYSFEKKIPIYVEAIKTWMEEEKPYLNNDFQLTDVSKILPLNRCYLSRVFNEGFEHNFSETVRSYRIRYAQQIIVQYPQLPLHRIAELSGFTSYATFVRAFQKVTGRPPKGFKTNLTKIEEV